MLVLGVIGLSVALAVFLWRQPDLLRPVMLGLLAGLTVVFAACLVLALVNGDELALESRSRGFGGGLGGCRASAALGLLVAVIVFGSLTVLVGIALPPGTATSQTSIPAVTATPVPPATVTPNPARPG